ncbi:MAG: hypothetical protein WAN30_10360, partial [Acidimicrobiales bacterium]
SLSQSPSVVWDELRHIDRHVNWMMDAKNIEFQSAQREGIGTSFICTTKVGPFTLLDAMTITTWIDKAVIGVQHHGLVGGRGVFTLSPCGTGTLLVWRETLRFPWWMGGPVGALIAAPVLRAIWRKNLAAFATTLP